MHKVKVRKTGISAEDAAGVIRRGLGDGYQVQSEGTADISIRKGLLQRANVHIREEDGGTVFHVDGRGLFSIVVKVVNESGIARRAAKVIGDAAEFRDDS